MAPTASPPRPPRPDPAPQVAAGRPAAPQADSGKMTFGESRGTVRAGHRIAIYGSGGVGKTTLAAAIADTGCEPFFYDLDGGSAGFGNVSRAEIGGRITLDTWSELIGALAHEPYHRPGRVHIVDTASAGEELAARHVVQMIKSPNGRSVDRISDYGYGKGTEYLYDTFLLLFGALDAIHRKGQSVVMVCHDTASRVPNPDGADFLQYQPRLLPPNDKGRFGLRTKLREWSDHLIFIQFDRLIKDDGKASAGNAVRSIHTVEGSTFWAKSRVIPETGRALADNVPFTPATASQFWFPLFGEKQHA